MMIFSHAQRALLLASSYILLVPVTCLPSNSFSQLAARNETNGTFTDGNDNVVTPNFDTNILKGYNKMVAFEETSKLNLVYAVLGDRRGGAPRFVDEPEQLLNIEEHFVTKDDTYDIHSIGGHWGTWQDPKFIRHGYSGVPYFKPSALRIKIRDALAIAAKRGLKGKISSIHIAPRQTYGMIELPPLYTITFVKGEIIIDAVTGEVKGIKMLADTEDVFVNATTTDISFNGTEGQFVDPNDPSS